MGIKTPLSLPEAQKLFPHKKIQKLIPTHSGVIDTTYIAQTPQKKYILKRYERALDHHIDNEKKLLKALEHLCFDLPRPLESCNGWHLFSYIKGEMPHPITLGQLRSIGRFMGKLHQSTRNKKSSFTPFKRCDMRMSLQKLHKSDPLLAKKLSPLKHFPNHHDGIIHGDLFPDNVKFDAAKLGVFDFIEAGNGSFSFDLGVVAMSWIAQKKFTRLRLQMLLKAYNQNASRKLHLSEIITMMEYAALIYALKRFTNTQSSLDHKDMLITFKKIQTFKRSF